MQSKKCINFLIKIFFIIYDNGFFSLVLDDMTKTKCLRRLENCFMKGLLSVKTSDQKVLKTTERRKRKFCN
ncbi:hypothetical protein A3Q56_06962 [Intoshia linei]|uniref:Uncharacterized protein n=1 Tax=Intoshia linei TaxID=1819745 RepID=A0A177ATI4_9BILA|nr:hypothetical protein A3Q56_06962 [Intoshia linei]